MSGSGGECPGCSVNPLSKDPLCAACVASGRVRCETCSMVQSPKHKECVFCESNDRSVWEFAYAQARTKLPYKAWRKGWIARGRRHEEPSPVLTLLSFEEACEFVDWRTGLEDDSNHRLHGGGTRKAVPE